VRSCYFSSLEPGRVKCVRESTADCVDLLRAGWSGFSDRFGGPHRPRPLPPRRRPRLDDRSIRAPRPKQSGN